MVHLPERFRTDCAFGVDIKPSSPKRGKLDRHYTWNGIFFLFFRAPQKLINFAPLSKYVRPTNPMFLGILTLKVETLYYFPFYFYYHIKGSIHPSMVKELQGKFIPINTLLYAFSTIRNIQNVRNNIRNFKLPLW